MLNTDNEQVPHEPLTEREQEIVELIAQGLTNQQIANQLHLTLETIKWYNRRIYSKLGVHSRTHATAIVRALDALDEPAQPLKHNLPTHTSLFIGREQELADIEARLNDPACRLLTLLGPGGIGKTRLALEAARRQVADFPDGIYFIQCSPVESPAFVMQALADGLDLPLTNELTVLDQVINYLRDKTTLLVIDNFEHLLDNVELLGAVLDRSNAVKMLVTSRERLRLKEEWVLDVKELRYPDVEPDAGMRLNLSHYEATHLFLLTAQRTQSDFVPDDQDRIQVARICQLVGGMPLGIELAASLVRVLSCDEIARGIAQNLDILTSSWRDVPERHRSIQAALDHSWNLLTPNEQEASARLTVFSGAFRHAAAAVIADASPEMLLVLLDKSFLQRANTNQFGIHELVKQYGRAKLRADSELWTATQLRHCRYHAAFLLERMRAPNARAHLAEVEGVFDDVQLGWRYAVENGECEQIQQFVGGFLVYYRLHSWYRAGSGALGLYQQALSCFDLDDQSPDDRATLTRLYESIGSLQELATAHHDALAAYHSALETSAANDIIRRGRLLGRIADVLVLMNQHEQGHAYYSQAESELARTNQRIPEWWREWLRIQAQRMELYYWQNRPEDMADLARRIERSVEQHGTVTERGRYLYLMGMMALRRDRYFHSAEAITYTEQALALSLETGNLGEIAGRYFYHGFSLLWSDQLDEAETQLEIARTMTEANGDLTLLTRVITYLTLVYRKRDEFDRVRDYATYCLRIASEAKMPQYTGAAHAHFAWLAWRAGNLLEAERQAHAAIEDWDDLGEGQSVVPYRWYVLFPLMDIAMEEEDFEQACTWARHMISPFQFRLPDDLTILLERAMSAWEDGQGAVTGELLRQALQLAQQLHYL